MAIANITNNILTDSGIATSSLVPYTGASADVNLGFNNFDANQINGFKIVAKLDGTNSGSLILRTGSTGYSYGNDSISLISSPTSANTLTIISDVSSVTKIAQIGLGSLTATRTFTLPDASGTLALTSNIPSVSGTSTYIPVFTGTNSLGNSQIWNNGGIIGMGTNYSNPAFYVVASSGDTLTQGKLAINTTSFSGTSVLQVNGAATLTGNLTGTTAIFNGSVDVVNGQINLSNSYYLTARNNANNTFLRLIGRNPSDKVVIDTDGYGTILGGALSGTSATFSSSVNLGSIANSGDTSLLNIKQSSNAYNNGIYLERGGERNGYFMYIGGSVDSLTFRRNYFGTQSDVMSLTRDGNVGIGTSTPSTTAAATTLEVYNGSNTNTEIRLTNSHSGQGSSAGFSLISDNNSIAYVFNRSNAAMIFGTNNTERMRISSGGIVGIGTSSPSTWTNLQVNGTAGLQTEASQQIFIAAPTTTVGSGAGIRLSAASGAKEAVGIIGIVNEASGNLGAMTFHTYGGGANIPERMRITSGGDVFIGCTSDPNASVNGIALVSNGEIDISRSGGTSGIFNRNTNDGAIIDLRQDNNTEGTISVSGTTISYNSFLGSHWSQLQDGSKIEILKGTILEAIDEMCIWQDEINDRLPKSKISDTINSKNVYGIFLDWDNDWQTSNDFYVAAVGLGYIRVNSSQNVSMGDLLQSNGDGTAKIQEDDIMRSSTIAKVVSTNKIETYEDGSYLIAATLHCG